MKSRQHNKPPKLGNSLAARKLSLSTNVRLFSLQIEVTRLKFESEPELDDPLPLFVLTFSRNGVAS